MCVGKDGDTLFNKTQYLTTLRDPQRDIFVLLNAYSPLPPCEQVPVTIECLLFFHPDLISIFVLFLLKSLR